MKMGISLPSKMHMDILNEVGKWRVIDSYSLFERIGSKSLYQNFCALMVRLEENGWLLSYKKGQSKKYFSLSDLGSSFTTYISNNYNKGGYFVHDLVASNVLRKLVDYKSFKWGTTSIDDLDDFIDPDGMIRWIKEGQEVDLGVEVELTQKSFKRISNKFSLYAETELISHVLYVTNSMTIMRFYKKVLEKMNSEVRDRIILLCDEGLDNQEFNYQDSECWFQREEKKFDKIFG